MCQYCERRQDIKFGWDQPPLCDENWVHPSDTIPDKVSSNLNVMGDPDWEARIHDYQTATPQLILTSKDVAEVLWGDGIASIYIPIKYCPVCGRKLGKLSKEEIINTTKEAIEKSFYDFTHWYDYDFPSDCCPDADDIKAGDYTAEDLECAKGDFIAYVINGIYADVCNSLHTSFTDEIYDIVITTLWDTLENVVI